MTINILVGDMRDRLLELPESVHACVTDPPYELGFMGKSWDKSGIAFDPETWRAVKRVLKPGAHLLAFGGTRTVHRIATAIEDAGFEIRDTIAWLYGSGFPKSLDVSKAIDKAADYRLKSEIRRAAVDAVQAAGLELPNNSRWDWTVGEHAPGDKWWAAFLQWLPTLSDDDRERVERETVATVRKSAGWFTSRDIYEVTVASTDLARQWDGWGTSLKPAHEPVIIARKPLPITGEQDIIVANLARLEAQLWSLLPASDAAEIFGSSQSEYDAAFASARWTADERRSTRADLSGLMGTSQFGSAMTTSLNIVRSWLSTLDAILTETSTCITETGSSQTIDWRTLRSDVSDLTPVTIIRAAMQADGLTLSALPAARFFRAAWLSMTATRELSALASATAHRATFSPDGGDLSPAMEPIIVARKPFRGTVAANVCEHGTGAINVDACRVGQNGGHRFDGDAPKGVPGVALNGSADGSLNGVRSPSIDGLGRWPANVILDEAAGALLDKQSGITSEKPRVLNRNGDRLMAGWGMAAESKGIVHGDSGGASRFFYCAKASKRERNAGMTKESVNNHPTVKPIALMQWLVRLVTPPGGTVIDPFMGTGTTAIAAKREGFHFIGVELDSEYVEIAMKRIEGDK